MSSADELAAERIQQHAIERAVSAAADRRADGTTRVGRPRQPRRLRQSHLGALPADTVASRMIEIFDRHLKQLEPENRMIRKLRTQRDNQQWMLDLALNMRGRVQNFEVDDEEMPGNGRAITA